MTTPGSGPVGEPANLRQRSRSLVLAAMYTTICRSSSVPPTCTSSASNGTNRCITGQLARYAAISASCAMRPSNSPRNSSGPTLVWSISRWAWRGTPGQSRTAGANSSKC